MMDRCERVVGSGPLRTSDGDEEAWPFSPLISEIWNLENDQSLFDGSYSENNALNFGWHGFIRKTERFLKAAVDTAALDATSNMTRGIVQLQHIPVVHRELKCQVEADLMDFIQHTLLKTNGGEEYDARKLGQCTRSSQFFRTPLLPLSLNIRTLRRLRIPAFIYEELKQKKAPIGFCVLEELQQVCICQGSCAFILPIGGDGRDMPLRLVASGPILAVECCSASCKAEEQANACWILLLFTPDNIEIIAVQEILDSQEQQGYRQSLNNCVSGGNILDAVDSCNGADMFQDTDSGRLRVYLRNGDPPKMKSEEEVASTCAVSSDFGFYASAGCTHDFGVNFQRDSTCNQSYRLVFLKNWMPTLSPSIKRFFSQQWQRAVAQLHFQQERNPLFNSWQQMPRFLVQTGLSGTLFLICDEKVHHLSLGDGSSCIRECTIITGAETRVCCCSSCRNCTEKYGEATSHMNSNGRTNLASECIKGNWALCKVCTNASLMFSERKVLSIKWRFACGFRGRFIGAVDEEGGVHVLKIVPKGGGIIHRIKAEFMNLFSGKYEQSGAERRLELSLQSCKLWGCKECSGSAALFRSSLEDISGANDLQHFCLVSVSYIPPGCWISVLQRELYSKAFSHSSETNNCVSVVQQIADLQSANLPDGTSMMTLVTVRGDRVNFRLVYSHKHHNENHSNTSCYDLSTLTCLSILVNPISATDIPDPTHNQSLFMESKLLRPVVLSKNGLFLFAKNEVANAGSLPDGALPSPSRVFLAVRASFPSGANPSDSSDRGQHLHCCSIIELPAKLLAAVPAYTSSPAFSHAFAGRQVLRELDRIDGIPNSLIIPSCGTSKNEIGMVGSDQYPDLKIDLFAHTLWLCTPEEFVLVEISVDDADETIYSERCSKTVSFSKPYNCNQVSYAMRIREQAVTQLHQEFVDIANSAMHSSPTKGVDTADFCSNIDGELFRLAYSPLHVSRGTDLTTRWGCLMEIISSSSLKSAGISTDTVTVFPRLTLSRPVNIEIGGPPQFQELSEDLSCFNNSSPWIQAIATRLGLLLLPFWTLPLFAPQSAPVKEWFETRSMQEPLKGPQVFQRIPTLQWPSHHLDYIHGELQALKSLILRLVGPPNSSFAATLLHKLAHCKTPPWIWKKRFLGVTRLLVNNDKRRSDGLPTCDFAERTHLNVDSFPVCMEDIVDWLDDGQNRLTDSMRKSPIYTDTKLKEQLLHLVGINSFLLSLQQIFRLLIALSRQPVCVLKEVWIHVWHLLWLHRNDLELSKGNSGILQRLQVFSDEDNVCNADYEHLYFEGSIFSFFTCPTRQLAIACLFEALLRCEPRFTRSEKLAVKLWNDLPWLAASSNLRRIFCEWSDFALSQKGDFSACKFSSLGDPHESARGMNGEGSVSSGGHQLIIFDVCEAMLKGLKSASRLKKVDLLGEVYYRGLLIDISVGYCTTLPYAKAQMMRCAYNKWDSTRDTSRKGVCISSVPSDCDNEENTACEIQARDVLMAFTQALSRCVSTFTRESAAGSGNFSRVHAWRRVLKALNSTHDLCISNINPAEGENMFVYPTIECIHHGESRIDLWSRVNTSTGSRLCLTADECLLWGCIDMIFEEHRQQISIWRSEATKPGFTISMDDPCLYGISEDASEVPKDLWLVSSLDEFCDSPNDQLHLSNGNKLLNKSADKSDDYKKCNYLKMSVLQAHLFWHFRQGFVAHGDCLRLLYEQQKQFLHAAGVSASLATDAGPSLHPMLPAVVRDKCGAISLRLLDEYIRLRAKTQSSAMTSDQIRDLFCNLIVDRNKSGTAEDLLKRVRSVLKIIEVVQKPLRDFRLYHSLHQGVNSKCDYDTFLRFGEASLVQLANMAADVCPPLALRAVVMDLACSVSEAFGPTQQISNTIGGSLCTSLTQGRLADCAATIRDTHSTMLSRMYLCAIVDFHKTHSLLRALPICLSDTSSTSVISMLMDVCFFAWLPIGDILPLPEKSCDSNERSTRLKGSGDHMTTPMEQSFGYFGYFSAPRTSRDDCLSIANRDVRCCLEILACVEHRQKFLEQHKKANLPSELLPDSLLDVANRWKPEGDRKGEGKHWPMVHTYMSILTDASAVEQCCSAFNKQACLIYQNMRSKSKDEKYSQQGQQAVHLEEGAREVDRVGWARYEDGMKMFDEIKYVRPDHVYRHLKLVVLSLISKWVRGAETDPVSLGELEGAMRVDALLPFIDALACEIDLTCGNGVTDSLQREQDQVLQKYAVYVRGLLFGIFKSKPMTDTHFPSLGEVFQQPSYKGGLGCSLGGKL